MTSVHTSTHSPTKELEEDQESWVSITPPNDVENALPSGDEKEKDANDPNLVGWEENDQENPRDWSTGYKSWITFQLSMLALAASLGSSITSPANAVIAEYVGVSSEVGVLSISLYM